MNHTGYKRVLKLIIPYFVIVGIFQIIGYSIVGIDIKNYYEIVNANSFQKIVGYLFTLIGTFFVLWIFMKHIDKEKFIDMGFHVKNRLIDISLGIIIGLLIMSMGYFILIKTRQIFFISYDFNFREFLYSFILFTLVAIIEEVLFRGYILKNLMLSFNKYIALIISSLLFALGHLGNPNFELFPFIDMFFGGLILGVSYIYTKNLWFPIALHFSWNFFQTHFGYNVSGTDQYSLIQTTIKENNLLNGGDFGFEGSILSIIFQLVFIFIIGLYFNKKNSCSLYSARL